MLARTGAVRIWHWAHLERNPHCEAARETEWHLAWKVLGLDGTQEVKVGRRRADVLAPGGFAVEFQASSLDVVEVRAREDDWAAQGGMVWVFRANTAFRARPYPRLTVKGSLAVFDEDLVKPENRSTLDITWSYAPERVRAASAPVFLDIGEDELLFVGAWRDERPLAGYGWSVPKSWVVDNVLRGAVIPGPFAGDPADVKYKIMSYQSAREMERQDLLRREAARQAGERMAASQRKWEAAGGMAAFEARMRELQAAEAAGPGVSCDVCGLVVDAGYAAELRRKGAPVRHVLCVLRRKYG